MSSVTKDDGDALFQRVIELIAARRFDDAIPHAERYVELAKAKFGDKRGGYGIALGILAQALCGNNRLADAEPLTRRAIGIFEKEFGAEHPNLGKALLDLADLLIRTGRPAEALPLIRRVLKVLDPPRRARSPHTGQLRAEVIPLMATNRLADAVRTLRQALSERLPVPVVLASFASDQPVANQAQEEQANAASRARALEIEAGRFAYQVPDRMWLGMQETVEVRLGPLLAPDFMQGFIGRGDVKLEHVPIVETMSVSLLCEPGAFDIEPRSQEVQLVKPDLVKGTAFHQADFGKWVWLVTPRESGEQTLLVKVSAAIRDSRGLPTTSSLPDKIIAVSVRVDLVRATVGAVGRVAPGLAWAVVTALVGVFTKDYWWPSARDFWWPAVRAMVGMQ